LFREGVEPVAATVLLMFERFVLVRSATALARALIAEGVRTRHGRLVDKGFIYSPKELTHNRQEKMGCMRRSAKELMRVRNTK